MRESKMRQKLFFCGTMKNLHERKKVVVFQQY